MQSSIGENVIIVFCPYDKAFQDSNKLLGGLISNGGQKATDVLNAEGRAYRGTSGAYV